MKKCFLVEIILIVLFALEGCGGKSIAAGLTGTVNAEGSTSMADFIAVLQEAFREEEPGVTVNFSGTGSGAGVQSVLAGTCDLGLSSRPLKLDEVRQGAVEHLAALDGLVLVVHPDNPVSDLSLTQIAAIFTGNITNWKELGGGDAPIAAYGREAGSGTRGAFEDLVGVIDKCRYTNEYGSTGDVIGSVSANPNAIGYASLVSVRDTVSAIRIEGVACTEETVRDGSYKMQRPFLIVTKKDAPLSAAAQTFLNYALSPEAAAYIARAGAISAAS